MIKFALVLSFPAGENRSKPLPVGLLNMVVMVDDTRLKVSTTMVQIGNLSGKPETEEDAEQGHIQAYMDVFNSSAKPHVFYDNHHKESFVYKVKVPLD